MPYADLRDYLAALEREGELVRVKAEVDPNLEITEILNRLLKQGGPAVIFENVKGHSIPVVANLYGTLKRVTMGLETDEEGLREIGNFLAYLQHPDPPSGLMEAIKKVPFFAKVMSLRPKTVHSGPCQEVVMEGADVDLGSLPILKCWPEDAGPLITWPLVITKPPDGGPYNVGVYRMQVIGKDQAILRWLSQRGGAKHYRAWMREGRPMPVAVAIGNEPATTIAAVTPLPEGISEFQFACLLRKKSIELVRCRTIDLEVPATSEIILEGEVMPGRFASEGPYGDHTGYYNPEEPYPIFNIKSITHRKNPLYLTTITGRPPREDAIIGIALNNIFVPMLRKNFPEVVDFHLPMEAISYRIAVVSIDKDYPGQA
ncbi:MAG: UbiD family decarboxylase, partial [Nitrospirota bacterium]